MTLVALDGDAHQPFCLATKLAVGGTLAGPADSLVGFGFGFLQPVLDHLLANFGAGLAGRVLQNLSHLLLDGAALAVELGPALLGGDARSFPGFERRRARDQSLLAGRHGIGAPVEVILAPLELAFDAAGLGVRRALELEHLRLRLSHGGARCRRRLGLGCRADGFGLRLEPAPFLFSAEPGQPPNDDADADHQDGRHQQISHHAPSIGGASRGVKSGHLGAEVEGRRRNQIGLTSVQYPEEAGMARLLMDDEGLRSYMSAIRRFQPLDRETELKLALRWRDHGDLEAAHDLVRAHLRFVVKVAGGYRGYGMRLADLIEEGNVGLLEAVRRFDPDRGLRFMTYAAYWIRAYILAHVLKQWSMVGVGTGPLQSKLFFRMARERAKLASALGVDGDSTDVVEMLAEKFGTSPERIRDMTGRLEHKDMSLDAAAFRDGSPTGIDMLADPHSEGPEERLFRTERDHRVRAKMGAFLFGLSKRDRIIVEKRLLAEDAMTLAEIGRHVGLSRERVRQLEERLKRRLRLELSDFAPQQLCA